MLNFIQNERTKLIVVASVAGIVLIGATISAIRSCSNDNPTPVARTFHYTCSSCGNHWLAEFSAPAKCPKCQAPGFITYWLMCPTCNKAFKRGDMMCTADKCQYRAPDSKDWVTDPAALTNTCPICKQVVHTPNARKMKPLEGWDPPQ